MEDEPRPQAVNNFRKTERDRAGEREKERKRRRRRKQIKGNNKLDDIREFQRVTR